MVTKGCEFVLDSGKRSDGKSMGKGFPGNCWTCREEGHSANQSREYTALNIGSLKEQGEIMCDGVRNIGQVEVDYDSVWKVLVRKGPKSQKKIKTEARQGKAEEEKEINDVGLDSKTLVSFRKGEITMDRAAEK